MLCTVYSLWFYHVSHVIHNAWKRFWYVVFLWRMMVFDVISVKLFTSHHKLVENMLCTIFKWVSVSFVVSLMTNQCFIRTQIDHGPGIRVNFEVLMKNLHLSGFSCQTARQKMIADMDATSSILQFAFSGLYNTLNFSYRNKHWGGGSLDMWNITFLFPHSDFLVNVCFCVSPLRPINEILLYLAILNFWGWGIFFNIGLQTRKS